MYDIYKCTKCGTEHAGYMGERVYQGLWTAHQEYREAEYIKPKKQK